MELLLATVLFAPLVGSIFAGLFASSDKKLIAGLVPSILLLISAISALVILKNVMDNEIVQLHLFDWIVVSNIEIAFGFMADPVSAVMICVVTIVSTVVHFYSIGYMAHDNGFNRFFAYLSLFVFSMLVLVLSDNLAGLFIGWEGVGLCSWLLIGFWYHKPFASWAANEAFIMNRVADLSMLVGIFIVFWNIGSLNYVDIFDSINSVPNHILYLAGVFLFIGAMGKSAQFPFHTWLADAMEGPTPVSALIHAATMVTAGVFLVIRLSPLYAELPEVGYVIACLGTFVALFAATMALVNRDLKRIVAYSTLSQLGYMFVAAGLGAYWVALFHLMTHAFFKALLFLGAGNVMHAMHDELDIKKMGGLYKYMKPTAILMIIGSVALAGIYPFAGFFSKDKILEVAYIGHHPILWGVLLLTAALTAFYSFRLIMLVFFTDSRYKKYFPELHPHEAYSFMIAAMLPLAILAVIAGFFEHKLIDLLKYTLPVDEHFVDSQTLYFLIGCAVVASAGSIIFTVYKYTKGGGFSQKWEETYIYKLLFNQYYIPDFYNRFFVKPYFIVAEFLWKKVDVKLIDALVDGVAATVYRVGEKARAMQSGNLSSMLGWMMVGFTVLIASALLYTASR